MMIIMHPGAPKEQIQNVIAEIEKQKLSAHLIEGVEQTIIGAVGDGHYVAKEIFEALPGVMSVQRISQPYKLASRQFHEQDSVFQFDGFSVGGTEVPIIAGPCSVESRSQILEIAQAVKEAGCADNGLLSMIMEHKPEMVIGIPLDKAAEKNTLYCTRTMGTIIDKLVQGESIKNIGIPDVLYVEKTQLKPWLNNDWIEGQIIFIDNFENVIVNITRDFFEDQRKGRNFRIAFKRDEVIERISESYADVPEGEKLALFNSAGYLEIAINKGNAAGLLGLKGYSEKTKQTSAQIQNQLSYHSVRIFFE